MVEERLEDREIADVLVGEEGVELVELLGLVAGFATLAGDLLADLPEEGLGGGAVLEVEVTQVEEGECLVLLLDGVVEALEAAELGAVAEEFGEVVDDLVAHLGLVLLAERLALVNALEDLDHEHGVGGNDGAARLADDVGFGDPGCGADLADVGDDVTSVLLHGVIHRRLEVGAGAVVIDAEAAADVEVTHRETHARQLTVEAGGLDHGVLDRDDVGDLRADVEVDEPEGGGELRRAEPLDREQNFGGVEAELGVVACGGGPLALAAGLELGAETDQGLHPGLGGKTDDIIQLAELLDDDDDAFP